MEESLPPFNTAFITITAREGEVPEVDLSNIDPVLALHIFRESAKILERLIVAPTVLINGQVIYEDSEISFGFDEED